MFIKLVTAFKVLLHLKLGVIETHETIEKVFGCGQ